MTHLIDCFQTKKKKKKKLLGPTSVRFDRLKKLKKENIFREIFRPAIMRQKNGRTFLKVYQFKKVLKFVDNKVWP